MLLKRGVHQVEHPFGAAREGRHLVTESGEVVDGVGRQAEVCRAAAREQQQPVAEIEDLLARLMDGEHGGRPERLGHLVQGAHDVERGRRVQATRGLVQEDDARARDELHTDRHAPLLPTGEPAEEQAADLGVRLVVEAHGAHRGSRPLARLRLVPRTVHPGVVEQRFVRRERRREDVVLLHVLGHGLEGQLVLWLAVDGHAARDPQLDAVRQRVQKRALPRARWAHEKEHAAWLGGAAHTVEDALVASVWRMHAEADVAEAQPRAASAEALRAAAMRHAVPIERRRARRRRHSHGCTVAACRRAAAAAASPVRCDSAVVAAAADSAELDHVRPAIVTGGHAARRGVAHSRVAAPRARWAAQRQIAKLSAN